MSFNVSRSYILNSLNQTGNSYRIRTKKTKEFEDTNAISVSKKCKDLINRCHALFKSDYSTGASTSVMTKMAKFIDSYNKLVDSSSETNNSTLNSQLKKMKECITENASDLKKIGISFKDDKLVIDKDKLTKQKSGRKMEELFKGNPSFINSMKKYAETAYKSLKNQTVDTEVPAYNKIELTGTASNCALTVNNVNSILSTFSKPDYTDSIKPILVTLSRIYAVHYNKLLDSFSNYNSEASDEEKEHIKNITDSTLDNSDILGLIGITVSESDNKLQYDNDTLEAASTDQFEAVFKHSSYSDCVMNNTRELFASLVKAGHTDINVNEYA